MQRATRTLVGIFMMVIALTMLVARDSVIESMADAAAYKGTHVSIRAGRALHRQAVVVNGLMLYGGFAIGALGFAVTFLNRKHGSPLQDGEAPAGTDHNLPDPDLVAGAEAFCASCGAPVGADDLFCGQCGDRL